MRPPVGAVRRGIKFLESDLQPLLPEQANDLFYPREPAGAEILQPGQENRVFKVQAVAEDVQIVVQAGAQFYAVEIPDPKFLKTRLQLGPAEAAVVVCKREIADPGL